MDKFGLEPKIIESYRTFRKAYEKLKEFVDTDNGSEKDRAAIIHAYEYTFELWWKALQRYLEDTETISEYGPGSTIRNAFQFGILEDGEKYMNLLRDRNLIAHTYKENIAIEIHSRIKENHIKTFEEFVKKFDERIIF